MTGVRVTIVRLADPHVPGWVEGRLLDAWGHQSTFIEKVPVVALADLDETSLYPQPGVIACQVIRRWQDGDGRELATIDTEQPWHVESTARATRFDALAEQLTEW
jgi:hypothetical protein